MDIGYARASAADQDVAIQHRLLTEAGCKPIFSEKRSGVSRDGRTELETALQVAEAQPGSALVVTRLDRLARSLEDLLAIAKRLKAAGASLRVLQQPIDTSSPTGELFFQMLGAFAQFETALRRERQMEGIAKARAEGRPMGRPKVVPDEAIRKALAAGDGVNSIKERLGVSRSSVYRVKDAMNMLPSALD